MLTGKRIAGVVVLFQPSFDVLMSVNSYLSDLEVLYIVDNSTEPVSHVCKALRSIERVVYFGDGTNMGIGYALNLAARRAIADGYDYLLTMDQDSVAEPDMLPKLLDGLLDLDPQHVGILAPYHATGAVNKKMVADEYGGVLTTMTSGNLLNLSIYNKVGPFLENLFIDYIDHEYCLRLRTFGYRVIEVKSVILRHNLGVMNKFFFLGKYIYSSCHPAIRRYYMTRNRFWLCSKYGKLFPDYRRFQLRQFVFELFIIMLFENDKYSKFKMILRGSVDFWRGRFGIFIT